jgi:NAD(P)H-flavin reductase
MNTAAKQSLFCELVNTNSFNGAIFRVDFAWSGPAPRAGQFFMVKPKRSSVFLARPISVAGWRPASAVVTFLAAKRGAGTAELADLRPGETAELTGPLGNAWIDFLPGGKKPIALVSGGVGIAPLAALIGELPDYAFHLYAGFKSGFQSREEKAAILGAAREPVKLVIATEDGSDGLQGRIPDFLEPEQYSCVCACGPEAMLKAVAARCKAAHIPCAVSLERRMACGVGACLGCTVPTINGSRRCCADGPVFHAEEIFFDDR